MLNEKRNQEKKWRDLPLKITKETIKQQLLLLENGKNLGHLSKVHQQKDVLRYLIIFNCRPCVWKTKEKVMMQCKVTLKCQVM